MYDLVDKLKRNAQINIAKSSLENCKQGKKTPKPLYFKNVIHCF